MRGIFNTGVLQSFTDHAYFPWKLIIGSSAGALTGAAYAAGQIHLARDAYFTRLIHEDFIKLSNIMHPDRHILNLDWMVDTIINGDEPLNKNKLMKSCPVIITAINCPENRKPETIYLNSKEDDVDIALKATAAIPFLYRGFVKYRNYNLLDGGLLDPIPYKKALDMGFKQEEILVVTTRKKGYRKKDESFWIKLLYESYYNEPKYKFLVEALDKRYAMYNQILDTLENKYSKIRVVHPPDDFRVSRLTKNEKIMLEGFEQGITAGKDFLDVRA